MKLLPTLFAVTAPSGSGKTSIMREVMKNEVVSFTTRQQRTGEKEGVDYLFINIPDFSKLKVNGGLIEETNYSGNYYGITADELYNKLKLGDAFVVVDFNGMEQLKVIYPDTVTIFIKTSKEDAIRNMLGRGDSFQNINKRLATFDDELTKRLYYDYVITNPYGRMQDTIGIVKSIVKACS